jgi:putative alpha-1,2-mannosidase
MYPMRKDYLDDQISFFPLTIASHRNGELFGILPGTGDPLKGTWNKKQTYDHDLEIARPYYFSTYFIDDEVTAEFVPGVKAGFYRFTFPENSERRVKLNIDYTGKWIKVDDHTIIGVEDFEGMHAWVYGVFSQKGEFRFDEETIINKRKKTSRQQPNAWVTLTGNSTNLLNSNMQYRSSVQSRPKRTLKRRYPAGIWKVLKTTAVRYGLRHWGRYR